MFGYDFMVDTSYNVWLIEVNSSPSMDYSSPITEKMVKEVLYNLGDIAMEQEKCIGGEQADFAGKVLGKRVGNFELIYSD